VDGGGETIAVITVDSTQVQPVGPGELLHARRTA
jgi:hypothetical protein